MVSTNVQCSKKHDICDSLLIFYHLILPFRFEFSSGSVFSGILHFTTIHERHFRKQHEQFK